MPWTWIIEHFALGVIGNCLMVAAVFKAAQSSSGPNGPLLLTQFL